MSDQEKNQCPNCGKKDSLFNKIIFLSQKEIDFINRFHEPKQIAYCEGDNCGGTLFSKYRNQIKKERDGLISRLDKMNFDVIPVITLPNPQGWEYNIIDLVNAQTTTGTGAITEIFAQVADFMGDQSERHNNKIQEAINTCKKQLRKQAISKGGNAILGCDVDITTGGTGNGLIIVCMSGTSILLKNTIILDKDVQNQMNEIIGLQKELDKLYF